MGYLDGDFRMGQVLDEYASEVSRENNKKTAVDYILHCSEIGPPREIYEDAFDKWKSNQENK